MLINFQCRCDYYEEDTWCEVYLKVKAPSDLVFYDEDFARADWVVIEEDDSTEEKQSHHWVPNFGECPKFGLFDKMPHEWHRNSSSCQLALCKKTPPYYFSEMCLH